MAEGDFLEIQRAIVNHERAKFLEKQKRLQKDIRSQIARSGFYNPDVDPTYEFHPFPETIKLKNGHEVIVYTQEEKDHLLGVKTEPPKKYDVDITNLTQEAAPVAVKRGRPPKVKPLDLPADLK